MLVEAVDLIFQHKLLKFDIFLYFRGGEKFEFNILCLYYQNGWRKNGLMLLFCSSWPRLKLNTKKSLHTTHHPPPTTQTLRQQYLSCYWPDLDETLNIGSWKHIQQITTVTTTFVQATFVLGTFVHISNISAFTDQVMTKERC